MYDRDDIPDDLVDQARTLEQERPVPRPAFRGALGRHLAVRAHHAGMLPGMRRGAAAYSASGLVLLGAALAGVVGIGPLAA